MNEFKPIIEKYNPLAGSRIDESLLAAKNRAKEKDCVVLVRFNGIDIFVDRGSDCEFLENYYTYKCHVAKYENALRD